MTSIVLGGTRYSIQQRFASGEEEYIGDLKEWDWRRRLAGGPKNSELVIQDADISSSRALKVVSSGREILRIQRSFALGERERKKIHTIETIFRWAIRQWLIGSLIQKS